MTLSDAVNADEFGSEVAASGDTIVIGAANKDVTSGGQTTVGAGMVYTLSRSSGSASANWSTTPVALSQKAAKESNQFGAGVAIDGERIVVGAKNMEGERSTAYPYTRDGTNWVEGEKTYDASGRNNFGSVAIGGTTLAIGDYDGDSAEGVVKVYDVTN